MNRPRVLFVIGSMGGGGAERQILEILKRLDRGRFEPLLYLAVKQGELLNEVPPDVPIFAYWDGSRETWPSRILRLMKLTRLLRHLHLAQVLRDQQIDIIYDRTYLATLDAAGGCWFRPTRRISCCVADPGPELELHARWSIALSKWFARRAYLSADVVLANSEGLRQRLLAYFQLKPDQVKVRNNLLTDVRNIPPISQPDEAAVGDAISDRQHSDLNRAFTADTSRFLVVNAGRLHPQKGHRFLLEAIEDLVHQRGRTLRLVIFGKGETEQELRDYIQSHHLESSVMLAGFVSDPRHWYLNADLFVLPSLFEGMPNALIEAVGCGIPALATTCPSGPTEILDHGRCGGLVPPSDSRALADEIADAMDHPDKWRAKAKLAGQRVKDMFNPVKVMKELEDLLENTIQ